MGVSNPFGKREALAFIQGACREYQPVLDVGAGAGIWGRELRNRGYTNLTALEVHLPYVEQYKLQEVYQPVILGDVRAITDFTGYHLVIMGDVLEHLPVEGAQKVLARVLSAGCTAVVSLPFEYVQDAINDNAHEEHLQADLTPTVIRQRYPQLQSLVIGTEIGVYFARP